MDLDTAHLMELLGKEVADLRRSQPWLDHRALQELTAATGRDLVKDALWGSPIDAPALELREFFAEEWHRLSPEARAFMVAGVRALQRLHRDEEG